METEDYVLRRKKNFFILERFDLSYKLKNTSKILMSFLESNDHICFCTTLEKSKSSPFIQNRTIFKNNIWVEPWWRPDRLPTLAWYKTQTEEEVNESLKNNQFFTCVIFKEDAEFDEYSYVISCIEDDIGDTLCIYTINEKKFINEVLPKIQGYLYRVILDI